MSNRILVLYGSYRSDRMGIRLEPHEWKWARTSGGVAGGHPSNILDNGYPVWGVNVCGNQPIILAADGPLVLVASVRSGGYAFLLTGDPARPASHRDEEQPRAMISRGAGSVGSF